MKRALALLISIILIFSITVTASAASASATLSGVPTELKKDSEATITVNVSNCPTADSALIQITLGSGLDLVSGEWKTSGFIEDFSVSEREGVMTVNDAKAFNGVVFSFVIKGKTVSSTAQSIKVDLTFNNGSSTVGSASVSKTVKVGCVSHTYGNYANTNATNHTRTCSACGTTETKAHTWNSGTVTKTANCKDTGVKTYTCTATGCGATKTETIAKTNNHTYGSWTQTKAPKCAEKGSESRTCSTCQKVETREIAATGHSFGSWTTTKAATCEGKGTQTRTCSKCSHKETKDIAALGHKFSNPTITKQPTCTETGTESGKCTVCGKTTTNTLKATGHNFGEWSDTKAATCTEKGEQEHKCSKCAVVEKRETDALGHDFDKPVVIKKPTLTEKGIEEGVCKTCGEKTQAEIPCSYIDEPTGIEIETEEGVFETGTEIKVEVIAEEHTVFETVKTALKEVASKFVAYDVSAVLNNAVVQPNGTVTVSFKIPEGFGKNVAVYYISDEGVSEKLESTVSEDGASISAKLSHFSSYAVVDLDSVQADQDAASGSFVWIIVVVAAIFLIGGGVAALIIIKKKKATIAE